MRLNLYHLVTYQQRAVGTPVQNVAESQRWKRRRNNPSDQKAGKNHLDYDLPPTPYIQKYVTKK